MSDNSASYPNVSTAVLQGGNQPLDYYLKVKGEQKKNKLAEAKLRDSQQARRDKQLDDLYDWAPEKAWSPYDEQVMASGQETRNKTKGYISQGYTPAAAKNAAQEDRDTTNLLASKSQSAKQKYESSRTEYQDNEMLDWEGYYKSKLNNIFFEEGNFLKGKDLNKLDTTEADKLLEDIGGYNRDAIAEKVAKDIPEMVDSTVQRLNTEAGFEKYKKTEIKANILGEYVDGVRQVKITPEFISYARQNPYMARLLDSVKGDKEAETQMMKEMFGKYSEAGMKEDIKTVKTKNAGNSTDKLEAVRVDDDFMNVNMTHNVDGEMESQTEPVMTADNYRLNGKSRDKEMLVDATGFYNIDTDEYNTSTPGDMKFIPTRVRLMPMINDGGKFVPASIRSKEGLMQALTDGSAELKWMVQGQRPFDDAEDANIMIPYDQMKDDVQAMFGFSLADRELKDIGDFELVARINAQNPDATPEQKAEQFKKIISQRDAN